jgi:hypothetical protein
MSSKLFWVGAAGAGLLALALSSTKKQSIQRRMKGRMMSTDNPLVLDLRSFSPEIIGLAKTWSQKRGIPASEVLATILLESRGKTTSHLLTDREDSRGLMQVNIRAQGDLLASAGYTPEDLYIPAVGIEIGTLVYSKARSKIMSLVAKCKAPQAHDVGTLTRLYYAGPAFVTSMLQKARTIEDTTHPFRNSEIYVDHWRQATSAVNQVFGSQISLS